MSVPGGLRVALAAVLVILVVPVWVPAPAQAAAVELLRWQEPSLGPHLSFHFRLSGSQTYTDYYFGAEGGGDSAPGDAALGWVRVRVVSTSEVVCTGVVVHPGSGASDVFRTCPLRPLHHYDLDWFVDSPDASIVLYGRDDPVAG